MPSIRGGQGCDGGIKICLYIYGRLMTDKTASNASLPDALASLAAHWRGDAPARLCLADRSGTGGERIGHHSSPVATPRLASSPSPARSRLVDRHREGAWAFFRASEKGRARLWRAPYWRGSTARIRSSPVTARAEGRARLARRTGPEIFCRTCAGLERNAQAARAGGRGRAAIFAAAQEKGSQWRRLLDIGCGAGRILELLSLAPKTPSASIFGRHARRGAGAA